ncbi:MAG: hypothetical protein Q4D17_03700, partial [Planctomycetia bacterium]|nr:hypothetical protein [Planctomycetia bacterium]
MKKTPLTCSILAVVLCAGTVWTTNVNAQNGSFYHSNGMYAGSMDTFGNTSTFRDNRGMITGTA